MIKLKDVALLAKVSEATASLVMNKRPGVNERTRERVLKAAKELGYTPNSIARGLAMRKTNTIGLVVTDIENPFFGTCTRCIDENTRNENYNLILSVSNDDLYLEEQIIYNFIGKRVDGIIIIPTHMLRSDLSYFEQLEKHNIPYVFSTTFYPGIKSDCVMTDLEEGSYQLTKYLIELGHRKIFFLVSNNRNVAISKLRIDGYMRAFKEADFPVNEKWIVSCRRNDFYSGYYSSLKAVRQEKPDAIMAINDIMALGAKRAIIELGYKIPDDISVAGYDDVIFSTIPEIPLTTVRQDIPQICRKTVNILIDKMNDKNTTNKIHKIRPELVLRKSTGICRR